MKFIVLLTAITISLLPIVLCSIHSTLRMDSTLVEDKVHLKGHLAGIDVDSMSTHELRFNYFKAHDTDGNNKLDGIEIINAYVHFMEDNAFSSSFKIDFSDKEFEKFIDPILMNDDKNKDGFIDYPEFLAMDKTNVEL